MFSSTGVSEVDKSCGTQQNYISIKVLLFPLHTFLTHSSLINHAKLFIWMVPIKYFTCSYTVCNFVQLYYQYKVSADHFHEEKFGLLLPEELWIEIIQAVHDWFLK